MKIILKQDVKTIGKAEILGFRTATPQLPVPAQPGSPCGYRSTEQARTKSRPTTRPKHAPPQRSWPPRSERTRS